MKRWIFVSLLFAGSIFVLRGYLPTAVAQIRTRIIPPTPTPTPTPTPRPTVTPTPTPTPLPTPTPTPLPTATPTPTPIPVSQGDLDGWFERFAKEYGIDRMKLFALAACESMLKTNATNGDYAGLYQFSSSTWQSTRITMGADPNPILRMNPEQAIKTAAYKISISGLDPWPGCKKKIGQ